MIDECSDDSDISLESDPICCYCCMDRCAGCGSIFFAFLCPFPPYHQHYTITKEFVRTNFANAEKLSSKLASFDETDTIMYSAKEYAFPLDEPVRANLMGILTMASEYCEDDFPVKVIAHSFCPSVDETKCFSILTADIIIWNRDLTNAIIDASEFDIDSIIFMNSHSHSSIGGIYPDFPYRLYMGWTDENVREELIFAAASLLKYTRNPSNQIQVDIRSEGASIRFGALEKEKTEAIIGDDDSIELEFPVGYDLSTKYFSVFADRLREDDEYVDVPVSTLFMRNHDSHELEGLILTVSAHPDVVNTGKLSPNLGGYVLREFETVYMTLHSLIKSASYVSSYSVGAAASVRLGKAPMPCGMSDEHMEEICEADSPFCIIRDEDEEKDLDASIACRMDSIKCSAAKVARIMALNLCPFSSRDASNFLLDNEIKSFSLTQPLSEEACLFNYLIEGVDAYPTFHHHCVDWTSSMKLGIGVMDWSLPTFPEHRAFGYFHAHPFLTMPYLPNDQNISVALFGDVALIGVPSEMSVHIANELLDAIYGEEDDTDSNSSLIKHAIPTSFNRDYFGYYVLSNDYSKYHINLETSIENFRGKFVGDHILDLMETIIGINVE
ncbi:hypothetical protein ADUPG1_010455 [Aduncisulcus paluster]|uniref:Uncharacterized protein n=1 Tax=Aduncisulcus paluster TaxID=2918883 RepID=A0ABQ5JUD6_9EUKA|nr:hypothetical protein ADUPG1_010455 [Aduncisulcus paluster]